MPVSRTVQWKTLAPHLYLKLSEPEVFRNLHFFIFEKVNNEAYNIITETLSRIGPKNTLHPNVLYFCHETYTYSHGV